MSLGEEEGLNTRQQGFLITQSHRCKITFNLSFYQLINSKVHDLYLAYKSKYRLFYPSRAVGNHSLLRNQDQQDLYNWNSYKNDAKQIFHLFS